MRLRFPIGNGSYEIAGSSATALSSGGSEKVKLIKIANQCCGAQGKQATLVSADATNGRVGSGAFANGSAYAPTWRRREYQSVIERKLAARHLSEGALALYDLSSSYFEGEHCPLAKIGHNRDGKKNKLQVNYGLLTTREGCPVAVSVYEGNTNDAKTLMPQVNKLREDFGLQQLILVGDRGTISHKAIGGLKQIEGPMWITALKSGQIRLLVQGEALQLGLFDERSLFEFTHEDYPGERLIACRNPQLSKLRAYKRQQLLQATEQELQKVRASVEGGRLKGKAKIGVRVGRVVNKYKVAKHFALMIEDNRFDFQIQQEQVAAEATPDGVYVLRTNVRKKQMSAPQSVRNYQALCEVERAFRSLVRDVRNVRQDISERRFVLSLHCPYGSV